ncbi:MAG: M1 family aminopeptidase [Ignavibacteria bacterium]|nr:M1 family aminopeptidase [Ignavibacteria bacterium]
MKTCTGMLLVVSTVLGSSFVHGQSHSVRALEYTLWGEILPSDHRLRLTTEVLLFNSGKLKADTIKMSLWFDKIESIQDSNGADLPYTSSEIARDQPEGNLHIFRALASQESARVRITHGGVYLGEVSVRIDSKNSWLLTESKYFPQPISHSDDPNWVRCEMFMTVSDSQTVVCPGKLVDVQENAGRRTFHWKLDNPPLTFLSVSSARYVQKNHHHEGLMITTYLYPEDEGWADSLATSLGPALAYYQKQYGRYPFEELKIVETNRRGGYGPPGMILINQAYVRMPAENMFGRHMRDFVLSHELAHHWWGGKVAHRFSVEGEQFLTEALAQYSALRYTQKNTDVSRPMGSITLINIPQIGLRIAEDVGLFEFDYLARQKPVEYVPVSKIKIGDPTYVWAAYYKGAYFLRGLETYLGDSVMTEGLRTYANQHQFKTAELRDLRESLEKVSGKDLRSYFDDWLFTTKRLDYSIGDLESRKGNDNQYRTTITVSNNGDLNLPLKVVARTTSGQDVSVEFPISTEKSRSQEIVTESEVASAVLDPGWYAFDADRTNNVYPRQWSFDFIVSKPSAHNIGIEYGPILTFGLTDRLRLGCWLSNVNSLASFRKVQFPLEWRVAGYYGLKSKRAGYSILLNSWLGMPSNRWTYGTLLENVKGTQTLDLHGTYRWKESSSLKASLERTRIYDVTYYDEKDFEAGTSSTFSLEFENNLRDWYTLSKLRVGARSLNSPYQFTRLSLDLRATPSFLNGLQFRLFAGIVRGTFPSQEALYLSGDVRSSSVAYWFLDPDRKISTQEHLHTSGDANLVGYFGTHQRGNNAVSWSAEYPILPAYRLKAFVGGGSVWNEGSPRVLWNAGLAVDLGGIRVNFPVYISRPMPGEHKFGFRWLIEIKF